MIGGPWRVLWGWWRHRPHYQGGTIPPRPELGGPIVLSPGGHPRRPRGRHR